MAQRAHSNLVPPHLLRSLWDEKRRAAQTEAGLCLAAVCLLTNEALWQHIISPAPPRQQPHTQIRCLNESDFFPEPASFRRATMPFKVEQLVPPTPRWKANPFGPFCLVFLRRGKQNGVGEHDDVDNTRCVCSRPP